MEAGSETTAPGQTQASSSSDVDPSAKRYSQHKRDKMLNEDPELNKELTDEERQMERDRAIRKKLQQSAKGAGGRHGPTADSIFGPVTRIMLNDNESAELFQDGISVAVSKRGQTSMINSKFNFGSPQAAGWELELMTNGFSDMTQVSYASQGRWGLMHQRQFKSGGMMVTQMMLQPQAAMMGAPPGGFVFVLRYPWFSGGTTQLQFVRSQQVELSHCTRLYRGLTVSATMSYDLTTNGSKLTYQCHSNDDQRKAQWFGKYVPSSGDWCVALTKRDWATDVDMGIQIEAMEKRGQPGVKIPNLTIGVKKPLIGGGQIGASLSGFQRLKAILELPFGAGFVGAPKQMAINQARVTYAVMYDIKSGGAKHGLNVSF